MKSLSKERIKHLNLIPMQYNLTKYLLENGSKTRREIVKGLNSSRTTVYDNLKKLEKKGVLLRRPVGSTGKRGRPLILWQIEQVHNSILLKQDYTMLTKQNKPKKNKTIIKSDKLPEWAKKVMLKEVKLLTYHLKILDKLYLKLTKEKKPSYYAKSYILTNRNPKLIKYILDEIDKCTYFNVSTLSKHYVRESLMIKYGDIEGEARRSTSNRIGRIVGELNRLGIVVRYGGTGKGTWKNLYKNNLHTTFNKIIEQKEAKK